MSATTGRPAVERVHPPDWIVRVLNPVMRTAINARWPRQVADTLMVLHFVGRRSGRLYHVPVARRDIGGRLAVLTNAGWRVNFRGGQDIGVTIDGRHRPAHATLVEDPQGVAEMLARLIEDIGVAQAVRQLGIRITVDRAPTRDELQAMVERTGLSLLQVDLSD